MCVCELSHVGLFGTPWAVAHQAPLSMEFSRQEYWSGLPCPSLGDLPDPGFPGLLHWRQILYHLSHQERLCVCVYIMYNIYINLGMRMSLWIYGFGSIPGFLSALSDWEGGGPKVYLGLTLPCRYWQCAP